LEVKFMPDSTIHTGPGSETASYYLVTGAQAEQALFATIQRHEQLGDSPLELAQALIKLGTLRQEKGSDTEAEALFAKALAVSEDALGPDHIDLVPALTSLGRARVLRGSPETAEPLLTRALTISERYLGQDHPDLVILVNDLTRMCLKNGAYSIAEPLLQRLLRMKRSKGEDHPEVATVLASLAVVHQSRGKHESAESLWRRVLDIRERTLAPNHFAHAIALEHLADVCAARGKLGEALQLFRQATTIREATLGSEHPSLRLIRERVADLELQSSEISLDSSLDSSLEISTVVPQPRRRSAPHSARPEYAAPSFSQPSAEPRGISMDARDENDSAAFAYRSSLLEARRTAHPGDDAPDAEEDEAPGLVSSIVSSGIGFVRKQYREILTVAGVMAFLLVAITANSRGAGGSDQPLEAATLTTVPAAPIARTPLSTTASSATILPDSSFRSRSVVPAPSHSLEQSRSDRKEQHSERVSPRRTEQPAIAIPTISPTMTSQFDSIFRAAGATAGIPSDVATPKLLATTIGRSRPTFDDVGLNGPERTRARLIGTLPTPRYPEDLRGLGGEVEARFNVDTLGRPDMSTFAVVSSPEASFSQSVRRVVSGLRFDPARSNGPKSQAVTDVVDIKFLFRPLRK
jgi:tetratricopeptide (TPR) repeat protein